jgi:hypothetical protein
MGAQAKANVLESHRMSRPRWEMELAVRIPEKNKRPGVCYALTNDGIELPVIDVTHPAFALNIGAEDLAARRQKFFRDMQRRARMPAILRRLLFRLLLRRSVLWRGLLNASNRFLSGMNTYLLKVGPDNLGAGYIGRGDRQIAGSYPVLAVRLRLLETVRLLADGVIGMLAAKPRAPLHLLNIGGGPAADSLNALILARNRPGGLLEGRRVFIHVLDLEKDAPDFGSRALAALRQDGAPLNRLDVVFSYVKYNWGEAEALRSVFAGLQDGEKVVALSTEGALFEYGSDEDILSNLSVFRDASPADAFVVGSVSRNDNTHRRPYVLNRIPVRPRGLPVFIALIERSGWTIERAVEGAFSDTVRLRRR